MSIATVGLGPDRRPAWPWPAPVALCSGAASRRAGRSAWSWGRAESWSSTLLDRLAWLRVRPAPGDPALCRSSSAMTADRARGLPPAGRYRTASRSRPARELGAGHATVTLPLSPPDAHRTTPIARAGPDGPPRAHRRRADGSSGAGSCSTLPGTSRRRTRCCNPRPDGPAQVQPLSPAPDRRPGLAVRQRAYPAIAEIASWRRETVVGGHFLDAGEPEYDGTPHGGICTARRQLGEEYPFPAAGLGIVVIPKIHLPAHASALLAAVPAKSATPGTGAPRPDPGSATAAGWSAAARRSRRSATPPDHPAS